MVKEFSTFSPCGRNFMHCGPEGKLKIWDTRTSILKQEFVPNLHLNQPCTSYVWLNLSNSSVSSWKTKKRKSEKSTQALALGTSNGSVAIYSLAEGNVICTLQGGLTAPVSCLAWSDAHGLFSAANNNAVIWDLESKRLERKWNCGKGKITCIDVQDEKNICITASFGFKIWDLKTKQMIRVLTGHSDVVTNLNFISPQYFITTAIGEKHIYVWNTEEERDGPIARFTLSDSAAGELQFKDFSGRFSLAATTQSGVLCFFSYQFNGRVKKSIKPVLQVEVANSERRENGGGVGTAAVGLIPVTGCHLTSPTSAMVAYGSETYFTFENIDVKESKETLCLLRVPSSRSIAATSSNMVTEEIQGDEEYVDAAAGVKRSAPGEPVGEAPLEARVANLSCDDIGPGAQHSLAQLLAQGLQSKDKSLVNAVLFRKDHLTVRHTVSRLPPSLLSPLIKHLAAMLRSKTVSTKVGAAWITAALSAHGSQLLADSEALNALAGVRAMAESRLLLAGPLASLSGRLSLLVDRPSPDTPAPMQQPLLVYNEEDSSDEGSSLGDHNEMSESEDKWEELSDQELSTDNMSS